MAYKTDALIIPIEVDGKQSKISINDLKKELGQVAGKGAQATNSLTSSFNSFIASAINPTTIAITGLTLALKKGFDFANQMEQAEVSFGVLTGSVETARKEIELLIDKSKESPLPLEDMLNATRVLLAYGVELDKTNNMLDRLGDIAAVTGGDLRGLALVYGQIQSAGRLLGQDALQLTTRGIPIYRLLAEIMGKSQVEVRKLGEQSLITADIVDEAFRRMTDAGGAFFDGQKKLTNTFQGQWEKVTESLTQFVSKLFTATGLLDAITKSLKGMNQALDQLAGGTESEIEIINKKIESAKIAMQVIKDSANVFGISRRLNEKERKEYGEVYKRYRELLEEKKKLIALDREKIIDANRPEPPQFEREEIPDRQNDVVDVQGSADLGLGTPTIENLEETKNARIESSREMYEELDRQLAQHEDMNRQATQGIKQTWAGMFTSIISMGASLMNAADGQSRELFEVGKVLNIAQTIMSGYTAVIESFKNAGGYPWGLIPAGIMGAIVALNVNKIANTQYGSGQTQGTAQQVNTGGALGSIRKNDRQQQEADERRHLLSFMDDNSKDLYYLGQIAKNTKKTNTSLELA